MLTWLSTYFSWPNNLLTSPEKRTTPSLKLMLLDKNLPKRKTRAVAFTKRNSCPSHGGINFGSWRGHTNPKRELNPTPSFLHNFIFLPPSLWFARIPSLHLYQTHFLKLFLIQTPIAHRPRNFTYPFQTNPKSLHKVRKLTEMCAPTEIESDPDGQKVSTFTKPIFSNSFQSKNSNSYSSQTHKFQRPHRTLFKPTKTLKSSQKCMCLATKIESDPDGQKGQGVMEREREGYAA